MAENRFVARETQLGRLRALLGKALTGQGQVAFVTGEPGAGKSALVMEFASRAQESTPDLVLAIGNCNAQSGLGDPYLAFREILSQLTGTAEAQIARPAAATRNASRLEGLARLSVQAVVELGPDLINLLIPGSQLLARAGKYMAEEAGLLDRLKKTPEKASGLPADTALDPSKIFEQYTNVLKALAVKSPLVLVLDDLHWADAASASLLFHLGRRIESSRILVLGTYRAEEVALGRGGERHPMEKVLAELKRCFGDVWVDLDQAEPSEARRFVNELVDLEPNALGESFRQALVEHTAGHPLFAVELLQSLRERGQLVQDEQGRWSEGPGLAWETLPAKAEGIIEERIGRLEEPLRETLKVGSVEGTLFTAEVAARVQHADERALVRRLSAELDRQHHLVAAVGSHRIGAQALSAYRFRHQLFQKYLYGTLDEVERTYLHEDVASALEALYADQVRDHAAALAYHWERAGRADKAVPALLTAGDSALTGYAYREAADFYRRLLALPDAGQDVPAEAALAAREGLGDALSVLGEHDAALEQYDQARGLAGPPREAGQLADLCRKTALIHERKGEYATALGWLDQGETAAQAGVERVRIQLARAGVLARQGQPAAALVACEAALQGARQLNARSELAHGTYLLGTIHGTMGHLPEEIESARQSLALYEQLGNLVGQANALNNLGVALKESGDLPGAADSLRRALELDTRAGLSHEVAKVTNNLGNVLLQQGQLDEAAGAYEKCMLLWTTNEFPLGVGLALSNLAEVSLERSSWPEAEQYLARSHELFQRIQSRTFVPELLRRQAMAALGRGAADQARELAERSVALAAEMEMETEQAQSWRVLGQARMALGQRTEARQALETSLAGLEKVGNRFQTAQTLMQLGLLWRRMAGQGDAEASARARDALGRARGIWQAMGAQRDLARLQEVER